jgi:hypothetical protein
MAIAPPNIRRWQRYLVDLPVRLLLRNGLSQTVVSGRGSEISEGGMALYVGIHLEPGDVMEVEFEIPDRILMAGIVRSRTGYCFGLEFLTPLLAADKSAVTEHWAFSPHALAARKTDSSTFLQQDRETPPPRAENDAPTQGSDSPTFGGGEEATPDKAKLDRILDDIAARALQATGATGVAIGLGRVGAMICRATAGLPLREVGGKINSESGIGAAAIRLQMSQWCSDTESDPRVDVEVCRQLGVRSIIVVPVRARDAVVGIFTIFSANPDAFSLRDLMAVKDLAHQTTEAIDTRIGNAEPTDDHNPVSAAPELCREKQFDTIGSKRSDRGGPRSYAARIIHGIVRLFHL